MALLDDTHHRRTGPALPPADQAALDGLVARGVLTRDQADEVSLALRAGERGRRSSRWLAEVAGYVGGALMFGGAGVLLATSWDRLTDASRAGLLAGVTALLALAGLVVAGGPVALTRLRRDASTTRRRVVGVLFAFAAGTAAAAGGVLGDEHAGLAASAAGLLVALLGYALVPTVFGLLVSAAFSAFCAMSIVDYVGPVTPLQAALTLLAIGACWGVLAVLRVAVPQAAALGSAAAIALIGAQQPLGQTGAEGWAYGLTLAVGLACFLLYPTQHTPVLLVAGVLAVAIAVPEAVWDATGGTASGAVILLVAGGTLVAASALGLRLWRSGKG